MNEAYEKPFRCKYLRSWDTECRRTAKLSEICSKNAPEYNESQETYTGTDNVFSSKKHGTPVAVFVDTLCLQDMKRPLKSLFVRLLF